MSSTTGDSRQNAPFREIPRATCERLLSEHTVGRVAWNAPDGPQLVPVNYAYYNKTIVFRTAPDGVLSQLARRTNVAFEIDGLDEDARTGWSVVVRGSAERVTQDFNLMELDKGGTRALGSREPSTTHRHQPSDHHRTGGRGPLRSGATCARLDHDGLCSDRRRSHVITRSTAERAICPGYRSCLLRHGGDFSEPSTEERRRQRLLLWAQRLRFRDLRGRATFGLRTRPDLNSHDHHWPDSHDHH